MIILRKFTTYIFASNVPEIVPFIMLSSFGVPLALTVAQILAIDLGTDILPALALGVEKPEPRVMQRKPRPRHAPLVTNRLMARAIAIGVDRDGVVLRWPILLCIAVSATLE